MNLSLTILDRSNRPKGSRVGHAVAAIAVIVLRCPARSIRPQSPIIDVPAAPTSITGNPNNPVTKTPPIPPFYNVARTAAQKPGTVVKSEPVPGGAAGTNASGSFTTRPTTTTMIRLSLVST